MTGLSCEIILLFTIGPTVTKTARINFSHLFGGASAPPLPTHTAGSTSHNLSEFLLQRATFINFYSSLAVLNSAINREKKLFSSQ